MNCKHNRSRTWLVLVSLLALVVIPEIRISDLGLVDVTKFERIDLIRTET